MVPRASVDVTTVAQFLAVLLKCNALVEFAMSRGVQCLVRGDGDRQIAARSGRFLFCAVVHLEERRCDGSSVTSGPGVLICMHRCR